MKKLVCIRLTLLQRKVKNLDKIEQNRTKQFEGIQMQPRQSGFEGLMSQKEGSHREVNAQDSPTQQRSIQPKISVVLKLKTPEVEQSWRISKHVIKPQLR